MAHSVEEHVWPRSLLLNQGYALTFQCVKCNDIPKLCMSNEDGDVLCTHCAKDINNTTPSKPIQKMINNLKTRCLTTVNKHNSNNDDDVAEGSKMVVTEVKDNECDWTGMISEWGEHVHECMYLIVACTECKVFKCERKLLNSHAAECPESTINCPLLCASKILRKNIEIHLNKDCPYKLLDCSNDDCKMQIKRVDFNKHINEECDERMVQCEFAKYGCSFKKVKVNELQNHMDECKLD
eukprot:421322_1